MFFFSFKYQVSRDYNFYIVTKKCKAEIQRYVDYICFNHVKMDRPFKRRTQEPNSLSGQSIGLTHHHILLDNVTMMFF